MEREYDYIKVYRKTLLGWGLRCHINRYGEDGINVLHRTRDHYRNLWGFNKVKLVLCWREEEHIF